VRNQSDALVDNGNMTIETRTLIELRDILGVEIECPNPKCKAKCFAPISADFSEVALQCFQCRTPWFGSTFDRDKGRNFAAAVQQIQKLVDSIRQLSTDERSDVHAGIRLHVSGLSDEPSARA
jgi:hypothetical protein